MRTIYKRICTSMLMIICFVALSAPVFAFEDSTTLDPKGGYRTGQVKLGGVLYNYTASIGTSNGVYTYVNVPSANIGRRHNNLQVKFITTNSGIQSATGGYRNITCAGASESVHVLYSGGMNYVKGYSSIQGTIDLFGDTVHPITLMIQ